MAFPYQSLTGNQIRLLQKVGGTHDRDLRFRFVYTSLNQKPYYTAMSYTWGSAPASEKIFIDDKPVVVSPNLWAGLHILRQSWQLIWADAVCINQKDILEKNGQVRMMDRIYAGASAVSVWLGVIRIPPHIHYTGRIVTVEADDLDWADSMDELANRPYWSRSWVIQEFLLAKEIHLYCGNHMVDEMHFRDLLSRAAGLDLLTTDIHDVVQKPAIMRRWPALSLVIERHHDRYPELPQPLYDLLAGNAHTRSSDPKDRIFSLLGLLPLEERVLLERCFPDYTLTLDQVNLVTIAHLRFFAGDQPCEPIFRALHIQDPEEVSRLLMIVDQYDYIGADSPNMSLELYSELADCQIVNDRAAAGLRFNVTMTSQTTLNSILCGAHQQGASFCRPILVWKFLLSAGLLLSVGGLFAWRHWPQLVTAPHVL